MKSIIYPNESFKIIGACYNVYNLMGCGFTEAIYQECLEIEFTEQQIPFESQKELELKYKGKLLKKKLIPDFVCYDKIIVEIKAVPKLNKEFQSQVLNYLNATRFKLGILVNFGHYPKLEFKRVIL